MTEIPQLACQSRRQSQLSASSDGHRIPYASSTSATSTLNNILAQDKVSTLSRAMIKKEQNSPCETSYYRHQDMIQKRKRCIVPLPIYTRKRYDASLVLFDSTLETVVASFTW